MPAEMMHLSTCIFCSKTAAIDRRCDQVYALQVRHLLACPPNSIFLLYLIWHDWNEYEDKYNWSENHQMKWAYDRRHSSRSRYTGSWYRSIFSSSVNNTKGQNKYSLGKGSKSAGLMDFIQGYILNKTSFCSERNCCKELSCGKARQQQVIRIRLKLWPAIY